MNLRLEFPVLVHAGRGAKRYYEIRPLFRTEPRVRARRYEQALRAFQIEVRRELRERKIERANMEGALWLLFNPELKFEKVEIAAALGDGLVKGEFSAAWFELKEQIFVLLPGFDNYLFLAGGTPGASFDRTVLLQEIHETLSKLIRRRRRESAAREEPWRPVDAMRGRGEFVTIAEFDARVEHPPLKPGGEELDLSFFFMSGPSEDFDGETEIEKVGDDLGDLFPDLLLRAVRRDTLVDRVDRALFGDPVRLRPSRRERSDPRTMSPRTNHRATVLIGPRGAGKTTLIHEALYRRIQRTESGPALRRLSRVWRVDPNRVIAGMAIIGQWQSRFEAILRFLMPHKHKRRADVLYIDNLPALARVGKSSQNDLTLADVLKPYLEKRELTLIAEATPEQWKAFQELNRSLADQMEVIRVPEPPLEDALRMVLFERARLESRFECEIGGEALGELIDLRRRFLQRRALPGAMIKLLRTVAGKHRKAKIGRAAVLEVFLEAERLAPVLAERDAGTRDRDIADFLGARLIGQPRALRELTDALHRACAGLSDPERPRAVFLFIGPTGVGKTEAARALASYLHRDEEQIVRFDMNEYVDAGAAGRLIGDNASSAGQLTERIRYQPHSVLLLDEIEKAHPLVHDLLLQVLGEGRLSDPLGRTTDFTGTMIVMTSNLGATEAERVAGFDQTSAGALRAYEKAVREFFRPEFLNRIDAVVPFERLRPEDLVPIARLQIRRLLLRDGFLRRNMILNIADEVPGELARTGFDAAQGGRALKRRIEKDLTALSADQLARLTPGSPMLLEVNLEAGRLVPHITELSEAAPRRPFALTSADRPAEAIPFLKELVVGIENDLRRIDAPEAQTLLGRKAGDATAADWLFYTLKDRLFRFREEVRDWSV